MNIYVSNLGFSIKAEDLEKLFAAYGVVSSVTIIMDKITQRSRGFGFVDMPDKNASEKAMLELNGSVLDGRPLQLKEAREREQPSAKRETW
jgi:RNA recognition motif-containing protein